METREGAQSILAHLEAIYVPTHDYVAVRETDYPHLDLAFYRSTQRLLEGEGFVYLEDQEDRTIANAPGSVIRPCMLRAMASADGAIMAAIYHVRLRPIWLRLLMWVIGKPVGRTVEFETEFADGSFVCTSNAMVASNMTTPAMIDVHFLPLKTPTQPLLALHRERVALRRKLTGLVPRRATTIAAVRASQNRMNALKAAYRGEIGGITKAELDGLSPSPEISAEVSAEIAKLQAERKRPRP